MGGEGKRARVRSRGCPPGTDRVDLREQIFPAYLLRAKRRRFVFVLPTFPRRNARGSCSDCSPPRTPVTECEHGNAPSRPYDGAKSFAETLPRGAGVRHERAPRVDARMFIGRVAVSPGRRRALSERHRVACPHVPACTGVGQGPVGGLCGCHGRRSRPQSPDCPGPGSNAAVRALSALRAGRAALVPRTTAPRPGNPERGAGGAGGASVDDGRGHASRFCGVPGTGLSGSG